MDQEIPMQGIGKLTDKNGSPEATLCDIISAVNTFIGEMVMLMLQINAWDVFPCRQLNVPMMRCIPDHH
jgi:hypothetical protein